MENVSSQEKDTTSGPSEIFDLNSEKLSRSIPLSEKDSASSTHDNSIEAHYLEEYPISLDIEKRNLKTYAYRKEDDKKPIKVTNYNISNAEFCVKLIENIKTDVVYASESTKESKSINYDTELKYITNAKESTNKLISNNPSQAIEEYQLILREVEKIMKNVPEKDWQRPEILKIVEQEKLVMSNLALAYTRCGFVKDAIALDERIIYLDPNFDKSYARLVACYLQLNNFQQAENYAAKLKLFKKETLDKYKDIMEKFEAAKKIDDENLKKLSRKSRQNEEKSQKKEEEKKADEKKEEKKNAIAKKGKSFWEYFIPAGVFVFGGLGLIGLYTFRSKFNK